MTTGLSLYRKHEYFSFHYPCFIHPPFQCRRPFFHQFILPTSSILLPTFHPPSSQRPSFQRPRPFFHQIILPTSSIHLPLNVHTPVIHSSVIQSSILPTSSILSPIILPPSIIHPSHSPAGKRNVVQRDSFATRQHKKRKSETSLEISLHYIIIIRSRRNHSEQTDSRQRLSATVGRPTATATAAAPGTYGPNAMRQFNNAAIQQCGIPIPLPYARFMPFRPIGGNIYRPASNKVQAG